MPASGTAGPTAKWPPRTRPSGHRGSGQRDTPGPTQGPSGPRRPDGRRGPRSGRRPPSSPAIPCRSRRRRGTRRPPGSRGPGRRAAWPGGGGEGRLRLLDHRDALDGGAAGARGRGPRAPRGTPRRGRPCGWSTSSRAPLTDTARCWPGPGRPARTVRLNTHCAGLSRTAVKGSSITGRSYQTCTLMMGDAPRPGSSGRAAGAASRTRPGGRASTTASASRWLAVGQAHAVGAGLGGRPAGERRARRGPRGSARAAGSTSAGEPDAGPPDGRAGPGAQEALVEDEGGEGGRDPVAAVVAGRQDDEVPEPGDRARRLAVVGQPVGEGDVVESRRGGAWRPRPGRGAPARPRPSPGPRGAGRPGTTARGARAPAAARRAAPRSGPRGRARGRRAAAAARSVPACPAAAAARCRPCSSPGRRAGRCRPRPRPRGR